MTSKQTARRQPTLVPKLTSLVLLVAIVAMLWFQGDMSDITRAAQVAGLELQSPSIEKLLLPGRIAELGAISDGDSKLYVTISLEFLVGDVPQLYPNLFQTSPKNDGIRIELHGSTLAAIIANSDSPNQPTSLVISDQIVPGQWYRLTVTALDGNFVSISLDGAKFWLERKNIKIGGTAVRLGVGLDDSRIFSGVIRNASLGYAMARPLGWLASFYRYVVIIMMIALAIQAFFAFRLQLVESWNRQSKRVRRISLLRHREDPISRRASAQGYKDEGLQAVGWRTTLWFSAGVGSLVAAVAYSALSIYFQHKVVAIVSTLLPGYMQTPDGGPIKHELMAYVLMQCVFIAVLSVSWIWSVIFRRNLLLRLPRFLVLVLPLLTISSVFVVADAMIRIFLAMATGFFCLLAITSFGPVADFGSVLTSIIISLWRRLIRSRRRGFQLSNRAVFVRRLAFTGGGIALGLVLLWPAKQAWYPIALPNDYYEAPDRFQVQGEASVVTLDRDVVEECLWEKSSATACTSAALLGNALAASSQWQSATGRLFFHHSYIFVPAKHWLVHGLDNAVPYLYGYGNTIFHGLLMAALGGTLSGYFVTYPIALLAGLLIITACVGYGTRSWWLSMVAFLVCLRELYAIEFVNVFLAASFSPLRYAGLALQVASVFFCLKGSPKRVAVLPAVAALSLFWNMEFGVLGLIGQGLALLYPQLRLSLWARGGALFALLATVLTFYAISRPSADIVATIFLGFFQVNMPIMRSWEIGVLFLYVFIIQAAATLATFTFKGPERAARLCILPVLALTLIKAIYNPSPPHMSITLAFILPMGLLFLPRLAPMNQKERSALFGAPTKSLMIGIFAFACWVSGMAYVAQAKQFKRTLIEPFVSEPWTALGETLPTAVPERPIVERVSAIAETARPGDSLLLLSPFDHILSFYANADRNCGHFELISNIATQQNIDQVVNCVKRTPTALVVYDQSLLLPCPKSTAPGAETECGKKFLAKTNVNRIFERLLPGLVEVGSKGQLTFYRKRTSDPPGL